MTIVDGHKIAQTVYERIRVRLEVSSKTPFLAVVLVGDHAPSRLYVEKKREAAERLGVDFRLWEFPVDVSEDELCAHMESIQKENNLSGLIVQLPLPRGMDTSRVVNMIGREIDVDYLSDAAMAGVVDGTASGEPPTPGAVMEILRQHEVPLAGATVAVVGTGRLVGMPVAYMLEHAGATVHRLNRETPDIAAVTREVDIVVSATGKSGLITGEMIAGGAVVIDAGISVENGVASGDIDFDSVCEKASLVTPTPGGVGPITVAKLLENTVG